MRDGMSVRDGVETNSWKEECGVFAVFGHTDAAELTHAALIALQHRGQEAAGIASVDGLGSIFHERGLGLVTDALTVDGLARLAGGNAAVGHVRYSTTGPNELPNAQPLVFAFQHGNVALAHNGNLVSAHLMKRRLETSGAIFQTTSDTEVVAHMVARDQAGTMADKLGRALGRIVGAYAFCLLTDERLYAVRDPNGLRPMVLGMFDGAWCVASESCALDAIGAELVRDVEPGELLSIGPDGVQSRRPFPPARRALCTFEHIYFARPDSDIDGHNVHVARRRFGELLAEEHPVVEADVVIGVPDSSISAAIGYAARSVIPYEIGLVKNRYVGRSFIQPSQELRARGVNRKLAVVRRVVEGRRVVMIDDSLVRGTTSRRIVRLLKEAGALEVHVRIASPPVKHSCYYGIDTSARDELVASDHTVDEIRDMVGADSLEFLSEGSLLRAFDAEPGDDNGFCNACFTGRYPTKVSLDTGKDSMQLSGPGAAAREVVAP